MSITRPSGEQLRFRSANTGDHVLDTYLEACEIGGRSLYDLLGDYFDNSGNPTFITYMGNWAPATAYVKSNVVRNGPIHYICHTNHTSGGSIDLTKFSTLLDITADIAVVQAAQAAAQLAQTNAETAETNAELAETNAETAETNAEAAQAAAEAARDAAQGYAAAAAAAAASGLFGAIEDKTTNFTIVANTDNSKLFQVDSAGGSVNVTLPSIATAGEGERYGFLRTSASNTISLVPNGTDTINGVAANYNLAASSGDITLILADDATPDNWIVVPWTQAAADESTLTKVGATLSMKDGGTTFAKLASSAIASEAEAKAGTASNKLMTPERTQQTASLSLQQSKSADYTLVLADAGKHIYHPDSDANSRTFTIPANGTVAFEVGTCITFVNLSANSCSIAITTDTMYLAGEGTTGTRTLAQYGMATAIKVASTTWVISGAGLS